MASLYRQTPSVLPCWTFNKFDNAADQFERNFDEYELETEKAGPVYQLIARYWF